MSQSSWTFKRKNLFNNSINIVSDARTVVQRVCMNYKVIESENQHKFIQHEYMFEFSLLNGVDA